MIKFLRKSKFVGDKFLQFWASINLPWGHVNYHIKFRPDRFIRSDIYWRQTNKQTDKQSMYELGYGHLNFILTFNCCKIFQHFLYDKTMITNFASYNFFLQFLASTNLINFPWVLWGPKKSLSLIVLTFIGCYQYHANQQTNTQTDIQSI